MKNKITFEEAMEGLEAAVARLESGNLNLDESIAEYEKAVGLIKICNEKITEAELKVKLLVESKDGTVSDTPFISGNED